MHTLVVLLLLSSALAQKFSVGVLDDVSSGSELSELSKGREDSSDVEAEIGVRSGRRTSSIDAELVADAATEVDGIDTMFMRCGYTPRT